ncbi:MAG TPA: GntR family transcriptional regulator [Pseudonocardia sp.]|uniref:GntR family transcriptional regulator n=1 Tax=Pseudonocardia sp. TaxID=60912 RepID=UPI002CF22283|nr:GntR family transcriptional regulator [Pseudonocardia sp.]HTF48422.1 GntR family transcriptional regulator [Pseudonocardia sp.]
MSEPAPLRLAKPGVSVDRVVAAVLARIASGELNPGEQLRQEDLAEELGFSRVPVREALHALAEQRVLVHQKHRGFFVAKRNAHEVAQFARMLELIEDDLLASIRWPTAAELTRLHALNERLLEVAEDYEVAETAALNREFHFAIFGLSPHSIMVEELERLWRLAHPYILADMITPDSRRARVAEHRAVIERLAREDRSGVVEAMARHRRRSRLPADAAAAQLR